MKKFFSRSTSLPCHGRIWFSKEESFGGKITMTWYKWACQGKLLKFFGGGGGNQQWSSLPFRGGVVIFLATLCYKETVIRTGWMGLLAWVQHLPCFIPSYLCPFKQNLYIEIFWQALSVWALSLHINPIALIILWL